MKNLITKCFIVLLLGISSLAYSQVKVSGTVMDGGLNLPLPGVNVIERGTSNGVSTDANGKFSITVPPGSTLRFSFVGYEPQEVLANGTEINVTLLPTTAFLDEIVVTGYGTQSRKEVTGAIASVGSQEIEKIATSNSIDAVKGMISGVDINTAGGRPGQSPVIRVRGRRSISASNDPLYVIDGVPQTSGGTAIFDINPQDIKSMEILKDAASTAIYGSRGANGVILITTKRGSVGKVRVNYSGYSGVTSATNIPQMMNAQEWIALRREAFRQNSSGQFDYQGTIPNDNTVFNGDAVLLGGITEGRNTNWVDLIINKGSQQSHQLSASGGSQSTQFNASLGYFDEKGIVKGMDLKRITGRVNLDSRINNTFKFGVSLLFSNYKNNWGSSNVIGEALGNVPLGIPYNEDGSVRFLPSNDGIRTNPLSEVVDGAFVDEIVNTRLFSPLYLQINLLDGLEFTSTFGPDIRFMRRGEFRGSLTNDRRGGPPTARIRNLREFGYTFENLLTYNRKNVGPGNLKATILQSIQDSRNETSEINVSNLPYESQLFYNVGTAEVKGQLGSNLKEWALVSFMGRLNYDIKGKYLFQASYRADGSSRLADGKKWAYFPGLSAAWNVMEDINPNHPIIDAIKLRVSYGAVGNTAIDPYQTFGRLARTTYAWNETPAFGYGLDEIPNKNLGWEISKTINGGFDFSLFKQRLSGSLEYYITNTSDLLLRRALPYTTGYSFIFQNIGATKTNGIEFELSGDIIKKRNFNWNVNFNITHFKEQIVELALKDENGKPKDDPGNSWFIGQPIRVFYDYTKVGIWQLNEVAEAASVQKTVPGQIKLADLNGNGVIDPGDRSVLGSDIPDFFGGINNTFSYKNFDLSVFFYFRVGHMIRANFSNTLQGRYNNLLVNYWTPDNPTNEYPKPRFNQEFPENGSTLEYQDGSFIKLRNLTLNYNFDKKVVDRLKLNNLSAYVQGQNLWFAAKYDTFDPEIGEATIGSGTTPSTRLISVGVRVGF